MKNSFLMLHFDKFPTKMWHFNKTIIFGALICVVCRGLIIHLTHLYLYIRQKWRTVKMGLQVAYDWIMKYNNHYSDILFQFYSEKTQDKLSNRSEFSMNLHSNQFQTAPIKLIPLANRLSLFTFKQPLSITKNQNSKPIRFSINVSNKYRQTKFCSQILTKC